MSKKSILKKSAFFVSALVALVATSALVIPLLIDVDRLRPEIERVVNERIDGKLKLGGLKLSLWGQIRVQVDGVELQDAQSKRILGVKDAVFHFPLLPLLLGKPEIEFRLRAPSVSIARDTEGELNLLGLIKKQSSSLAVTPAQKTSVTVSEIALPGLILRSRLTLQLERAELNYRDEKLAFSSQIRDLNVRLRNLSLLEPSELAIWADLDTQVAKTLQVRGPFRVDAIVKPELIDAKLVQVAIESQVKLNELQMSAPGRVSKARGVPLELAISARLSESKLELRSLILRAHNAALTAKGEIRELKTSKIVQLDLQSNTIEIGQWGALFPMLSAYEPEGRVTLRAQASGPVASLQYQADVEAQGVTLKVPYTKAKPTLAARVQVRTDRIENLELTLQAPGNALKLAGQLESFQSPRFRFKLTSSGLDLDQWLQIPRKTSAQFQWVPSAYAEKEKSDFDKMLDPLRKSVIARAAQGTLGVDVKKVVFGGISFHELIAELSLRDLVAQLERASFRLIGGQVSAKASADLKPAQPTYKFEFKAAGIEANEAVVAQFPVFKRTIYGKIDTEGSGQGASFDPQSALKKLQLQGKFSARDAVFSTIDIAKMTQEALTQALERAGDRIPGLKGKKLPVLPDRKGKYQSMTSDFRMKEGVFDAPNFIARAYPGNGVDLKGSTQVGLIDYAIDARWYVTDPHNITQARDLSIEVSGTKVDHILARGSEPVGFPVTVGCKIMEPCYRYTEVAEHFGKIALANIADAGKGRLKTEAQNQVEEAVKKIAPNAPVKNLIKGLFK
jgi:uncharacterized protein involved in outer membrane biogenesis